MAENGVKWKMGAVVPVGSCSLNQVQIPFDISPRIPVWMQETLGIMRRKIGIIRGFGESSFNYILAATGFIVSSRLSGKSFGNEMYVYARMSSICFIQDKSHLLRHQHLEHRTIAGR